MHPRQSWLALSLLAALSVQGAVIYRWVDADGVVHYSDQQQPGAERIVTSAPNTSPAGARSPANGSQAARRPSSGSLNYSEFTIASPQPDQTFFGTDPVPVHLNLSPGLQPGHSITWHMNGKQLDEQQNSMSFAITQLDRGTYSVVATITDQQTGESLSSNSVTFFVRQTGANSPQSPLRR
jgi:Domain of unknown function (DUF4124)